MAGIFRRALGFVSPGFRPLSAWAEQYVAIIATRPLSAKTLQNRKCNVAHILAALGNRPIRSIRPADVGQAVRAIWDDGRTFTARRVLIEASDMLNEAVLAGWIDTNPAIAVKALPARVQRRRLTLEQWSAAQSWALTSGQPWLPHAMRLALVTGQRRADIVKMGFADVWDEHLHIVQQKTGARIALPLDLSLPPADLSLRQVIAECTEYAPPGATFIRRRDGAPLSPASLTIRFQEARERACGPWDGEGMPPTLHECRSLSERLYRAQGLDTKTLLGHRRQSMTDAYNDDRGLSRNDYKRLVL